jgi:hypothetical protein
VKVKDRWTDALIMRLLYAAPGKIARKYVEKTKLFPKLKVESGLLRNLNSFSRYVLDEYRTSRRSVLVRAFIDALTQGGPGGTPKPIEMHAHDPKRYVGDMLAFLHQSIPSERENLLMLLKGCDKTGIAIKWIMFVAYNNWFSSSQKKREQTTAQMGCRYKVILLFTDVADQIQQTLSNITEGVCHPLKVRVEHILAADTPATVLYSIANLIRFYKQVIGQVGLFI